jgi:hypothetical protein
MSVDTGDVQKALDDAGTFADAITVDVLLAADDAGTLSDLLSVDTGEQPGTGGVAQPVAVLFPKRLPPLEPDLVPVGLPDVGTFADTLTVEVFIDTAARRRRAEAELIALDIL